MPDVPESPRSPAPPETLDIDPCAALAPKGVPAASPSAVGQASGDYELLEEIARGGMGIVYKARVRRSGQLVALKMMLEESASSPADLTRFTREAQATSELQHPGVVALHAWGLHNGHPFYTMDFVTGQPLHRLLEGGPLPVDRAVRYLLGVARALAAAHALGIVHRDLKPSNVMIDASDQPRVLDFGLAKRHRPHLPDGGTQEELPTVLPVSEAASASPTHATPQPSVPLTEKGAILGTPSYMAPEQVRAEHDQVGPAADVHALGAIFYEMLTGRPPYQGESTYLTLMKVLDSAPEPLRSVRPEVPSAVEVVVERCLEKQAEDRYANAAELAEDLEQRWQRWALSRRFARSAMLAMVALLGLQIVQPLLVAGVVDDQGGFAQLVQSVAGPVSLLGKFADTLDRLIIILVTIGGPLLGGLGLLGWSAAWVWYGSRPRLLTRLFVLAAVGTVGVWLLLRGIHWPWGSVFLPWLLVANGVAVFVANAMRQRGGVRRSRGLAKEGGSYLQKLFAVRGTARPQKATLVSHPIAEIADFELGKLLYEWETGAVHWARQQSLDRAVLVWRAACPSRCTLPGVVVRHPCVLGLHAVNPGPEGCLLVTEPAAASPLAEVLTQRSLSAAEAIQLTAELAGALQAFHDQGACHGRLGVEWILVRGDLEPLLCPCGVPNQSQEARTADVRALAELMHSWLPTPSWLGRYHKLAPVYRTCQAAQEGHYPRASDFAADLRTAAVVGRARWRERQMHALSFLFLLLPWPAVLALWETGHALGVALLGLCLGGILFGYVQLRALIHRLRYRGGGRPWLLPPAPWQKLAQSSLFVGLATALAAAALPTGERLTVLPRLGGVLLGYALIGVCAAVTVTFGEFLAQSLEPRRTER